MDRETKRRQASLREVFRSFDLDMSGKVEKDELMLLAKARRKGKSGVAAGSWDPAKNERLVKRITSDADGKIGQAEFIRYFLEQWHGGMETFSSSDFDHTTESFLEIAARAQRSDSKHRRTRLNELFAAFDLDNNGAVEGEEFFKLARAKRIGVANEDWTEDRNESLMRKVDMDRNGTVDQQEFLNYFNNVWHGGMALFSNSDFDETIDFFLTLPGMLKSGAEETSPAPAPAPTDRSISPKTRSKRAEKLRDVFQAFDIDQGGTIGEGELLQLGQARRQSGQATGEWTIQRNRRLIARMTKDNGSSGNITEDEFVDYFDDILPGDPASFQLETDNFLRVAQIVGSPADNSSPVKRSSQRVPKLDVSSTFKAQNSPSVSRTPREREAGLNGIFRLLDMDRTGKISKKHIAYLTSQATQTADLSSSWSVNQNRNALDNLSYSRGAVSQSDFVYFFKSTWYGGIDNLSDAEYDKAIQLLRTIGRKVQTEGIGSDSSMSRSSKSTGRSSAKEESSEEERKFTREKNLRLREVFSLLDFSRCGDLHRADLRVLGALVTPMLDTMNEEGIECVSSSAFLEMLGDAMSKDAEEFSAQADDLDSRAKASRKAKESERRDRRINKLERVFDAFDLDGSGSIERDELFELGKARRTTNQRHGSWTEEKNNRLVEKLDVDHDMKVSKEEFTTHFEQMLTFNEDDFDETMSNFTLVAEHVHLAKSHARAAQLQNMDPIERAKYEAASFTKDADISIFKAKQEEGVKDDARTHAEKVALDKAIKELLARQGRETAHEEVGCTEITEARTKQKTEDFKYEHKVVEEQQEVSVTVEAHAAADVEVAIQSTQSAHSGHKKVARIHQAAYEIVEAKSAAKAQRAQEVADLEELLRLARQAFGVAEEELHSASADEQKKSVDEKAARVVLKAAKTKQAEAEEAHRLAHADMVEKTKLEKEKHRAKKYEEHKAILVEEMAITSVDGEKISIREMEEAIESSLKYARVAVTKRDDHSEAAVEAWIALDEKRVRGVEEIAAVDWWDAESARQTHQKAQLNAAEKKENVKKAELRADWEDRRSVFARNRDRDPAEIKAAQETASEVRVEHEGAKATAQETKMIYQVNADKARESTEEAKRTRDSFEAQVEIKREQVRQLRRDAIERGTKTYKEFLVLASREISGSGKVDQEALFAKIERALAMAMKGVDIYSSIPEKSTASARTPAPASKYDDEDYMPSQPPAPNTPSPVKPRRSNATPAVPQEVLSPRSHAKAVHPWKQDGETPLDGPAVSESPSTSPRNRSANDDARRDRDNRLDSILDSAEKQFDNDFDQGEFTTLEMAHKYKTSSRDSDGDILLATVTSQAAKDKFNAMHGTKY